MANTKIGYSGKADPKIIEQVKDIAWANRVSFSNLVESLMENFVKTGKGFKRIDKKV